MAIQIRAVVSNGFEENAYLIYRDDSRECVVVDPGLSPEKLLRALQEADLTPVAVLCTHGHADHIAGIPTLRERFPNMQIVIGKADAPKLTDPRKNLSTDFGVPFTAPTADVELTEPVQTVRYAGIDFEARLTPGHTAGHYTYVIHEMNPKVAFVGDLVFYRSVGRSDFYDGNYRQLETSIRTQIYTLDDATILYTGHGPSTLVGTERKTNPFVKDTSR